MSDDDLLPDAVWDRHANPLSGWSRLLATPVLFAAIYWRRPRLLLATVAFLVLNPVLFSPPDEDAADDFMYRVVRAEEAWDDTGNSVLALTYPQVLNVLNLGAAAYALVAAVRRRPLGTALGCAATMGLKLWYVGELVRRYDRGDLDGPAEGDLNGPVES
jgi:hypothetical protein